MRLLKTLTFVLLPCALIGTSSAVVAYANSPPNPLPVFPASVTGIHDPPSMLPSQSPPAFTVATITAPEIANMAIGYTPTAAIIRSDPTMTKAQATRHGPQITASVTLATGNLGFGTANAQHREAVNARAPQCAAVCELANKSEVEKNGFVALLFIT